MNIYLMNATLNGKIYSEILCRKLSIKGMITLDDNGASKTNEYYDYTNFCEERGIECIKVSTYNLSEDEDRKMLEKLDIDLLLIASWQRLIPEWLINKCTIGVIGCHGSHEGIERGRGRSPQNWALITGKKKFSMSIFWIEPGTDNGDIIDTIEFEYLPTDTILVSYIKISIFKAQMVIKNIENGRIWRKEGIPQNKEGFYLPQRVKEDGKIDWHRDARDISNMVRALTKPYPGAYTIAEDKEYFIWSARPVVIENDLYDDYDDGTVLSILGESLLVKCGRNLLLIDECTNFADIKEETVFESADYQKQIKEIIDRHNKKYKTPLSRLVLDEMNDV